MSNSEEVYIDFASKISFLEFIQDEFKDADIPIEKFSQEINLLESEKKWNIGNLSEYVKKYPRSFIVFQNIFQLLRFTNAQLIHFVFDIVKLNSLNINAIYEYMILNIKYDLEFRKMYLKTIDSTLDYNTFILNLEQYDKKFLVASFKLAISKYINKIVKNFYALEARIKKSEFADL